MEMSQKFVRFCGAFHLCERFFLYTIFKSIDKWNV